MIRRHLLKGRIVSQTFIFSIRAAGMKVASHRGIDRAGDLSFKNNFLPFQSRVRHRDGGKESLGVGMPGILIEDRGRSHFDDLSQVHNGHVITDIGHHIEVVRNK